MAKRAQCLRQKGKEKAVSIDAAAAEELAFYKSGSRDAATPA
jgi:hypothetical protein